MSSPEAIVTSLLRARLVMRMGLREANQSFSKAIKAVKAGKEIVLTDAANPLP
jgi:hypothetical protein